MGAGRVMMDQDKLQELRELVDFLKENGIAEFDMDNTDMKVRIKFAGASAGLDASQLAGLLASARGGGGGNVPSAAAAVPAAETVPEEKLHEVKSPIVGTFYESPSPGSPAFVKPGDQVEVGQILCIVEAMKLMNEITTDFAGIVTRILPENGQLISLGEEMFWIEP